MKRTILILVVGVAILVLISTIPDIGPLMVALYLIIGGLLAYIMMYPTVDFFVTDSLAYSQFKPFGELATVAVCAILILSAVGSLLLFQLVNLSMGIILFVLAVFSGARFVSPKYTRINVFLFIWFSATMLLKWLPLDPLPVPGAGYKPVSDWAKAIAFFVGIGKATEEPEDEPQSTLQSIAEVILPKDSGNKEEYAGIFVFPFAFVFFCILTMSLTFVGVESLEVQVGIPAALDLSGIGFILGGTLGHAVDTRKLNEWTRLQEQIEDKERQRLKERRLLLKIAKETRRDLDRAGGNPISNYADYAKRLAEELDNNLVECRIVTGVYLPKCWNPESYLHCREKCTTDHTWVETTEFIVDIAADRFIGKFTRKVCPYRTRPDHMRKRRSKTIEIISKHDAFLRMILFRSSRRGYLEGKADSKLQKESEGS